MSRRLRAPRPYWQDDPQARAHAFCDHGRRPGPGECPKGCEYTRAQANGVPTRQRRLPATTGEREFVELGPVRWELRRIDEAATTESRGAP